ncbi:MAG: hypothetical protein M1548_04945 [Actinobacteria bacterium]|nr:hypothetical protein [Actinomycetota bacterium]
MEDGAVHLKVIAEKQPRLENVEAYVPGEELNGLRGISGLAVVEVAGRDSVAAILRAVGGGVKDVLPTIVYTGTEYGDWSQLDGNINFLKSKLAERGAVLHEPVTVGDPRLWAALCGQYAGEITRRYGPCGFCAGCHLYMHLCRVPLALATGAKTIISGERESHEGRVKLNQTRVALDAYSKVIALADIELSLPIRHVELNAEIEAMVGPDWREDDRQLKCVLSRNYERVDGHIACDLDRYNDYLNEFLVPAGKRLLETLIDGGTDYADVVKSVIKEIERDPI